MKRAAKHLQKHLVPHSSIVLSAVAGSLVLAAVFYLGWKSQSGVGITGSAFGRTIHLQVWSNYLSQPGHLHFASALHERGREIQKALWLDEYDDSELAVFNRGSQPGPYPVPEILVQTLEQLVPTTKPTLGMFEPTLKPLMDTFWPTDAAYAKRREPATPEAWELDSMREYLGMDKISWTLSPPTLTKKHAHVYLDFSPWFFAILAEQFEQSAIRKNVTALEILTDGMLHVYQHTPVTLTADARAQLTRQGVKESLRYSGSLAWLDSVQVGALRSPNAYYQTVDPKRLKPVSSDVSAVAVFCRSSIVAATWARAALVLGVDRTLALANRWEVPVRMRTQDGKFVRSEGWAAFAQAEAKPDTMFCGQGS